MTTFTDSAGNPLSGETVMFAVAGVHTVSGTAPTDALGQAEFTYPGTVFGNDTITACVCYDLILAPAENVSNIDFYSYKPVVLTIIVKTKPRIKHDFDFMGDLGDFTLTSGTSNKSKSFEVPPGVYNIGEQLSSFPPHWVLLYVICKDQDNKKFGPDLSNNGSVVTVDIPVNTGQEITCRFHNERTTYEGENNNGDHNNYLPFVAR